MAQGKRICVQYRRGRRRRFDLWVRKILWRRAWQPGPVFLPGESPWAEEPGRLQYTEWQRVDITEVTEHARRQMTS